MNKLSEDFNKLLVFIETLAVDNSIAWAECTAERSYGNYDDCFSDGYECATNVIGIRAEKLLKELRGGK